MRMPRRFRPGRTIFIALIALLAMPTTAAATVNTLTVDSTVDPGTGGCTPGACTLREAITQLNDGDTTDQDRISFVLPDVLNTISLGTTLPLIDEPLQIARSHTSGPVEVSGSGAVRPFLISTAISGLVGMDVSFSTFTVKDGVAAAFENGAGIDNSGADLTLSSMQLSDNGVWSDDGGGLTISGSDFSFSDVVAGSGVLIVSNSDFSDGEIAGGGVASQMSIADSDFVRAQAQSNISSSPLSISNSDFTDAPGPAVSAFNGATISGTTIKDGGSSGCGGGVRAQGQPITIEGSTIAGNTARSGGGVCSERGVTIQDSTISGNTATGDQDIDGGGGVTATGYLSIYRSTISGNHTTGSSSVGAGIFYSADPFLDYVWIAYSTIAGNDASGSSADGAGLYSRNPTGFQEDPELFNTIVANNGTGPDLSSDGYDTVQLNFSLVESMGDTAYAEGWADSNIFGIDPELGLLANNGGPTLTQLPTPTSPVVDQGLAPPLDQRGMEGPIDIGFLANAEDGNGSDIGAVELTLAEATPAPEPEAPPGAPAGGTPLATAQPTGQRAAALKKCKKKRGSKRKKCKKRALRLPV